MDTQATVRFEDMPVGTLFWDTYYSGELLRKYDDYSARCQDGLLVGIDKNERFPVEDAS